MTGRRPAVVPAGMLTVARVVPYEPVDTAAPTAPDVANGETVDTFSPHWAANPCIRASLRVGFAADGTSAFHNGYTGRQSFT